MDADEGLREVIRENPEDDIPRLIYADWLEERGDPRGTFIRVQCELARLEKAPCPREWVTEDWREECLNQPGDLVRVVRRRLRGAQDDGRFVELRLLERELFERHGEEWLAPLGGLGQDWRFERGFVTAGTVAASRLAEAPGDLAALAPLVRDLRLSGYRQEGPRTYEALDSPLLSQVRILRLSGEDLEDGDLSPLVGDDHTFYSRNLMRRLEGLDLSHNRLRLEEPIIVREYDPECDYDYPIPLRILDVSHNQIGPAGVHALAHFNALESLDVSHNHLGAEGAVGCARLPSRVLNLSYNGIGDEIGDRRLSDGARGGYPLKVESFHYAHLASPLWRGFMDVGIWGLGNLTMLDLSGNRISSLQDLAYHHAVDPRAGPIRHLYPRPAVDLPEMLDLRYNVYDRREAEDILRRASDDTRRTRRVNGIALSWAEPISLRDRPGEQEGGKGTS